MGPLPHACRKGHRRSYQYRRPPLLRTTAWGPCLSHVPREPHYLQGTLSW
uniref:Uncharacterized protein n=1 Tax=Arundo donax TaxID=35708 RepID=A0A0A9B065_ARUDO